MMLPSRLHFSLVCSQDKIKSKAAQKSFKKFDPYKMRADFPDLWANYLRTAFRTPEDVRDTFNVTLQCAYNWWSGEHRPSGDKVAFAAMSDPVGFAAAMGRAA